MIALINLKLGDCPVYHLHSLLRQSHLRHTNASRTYGKLRLFQDAFMQRSFQYDFYNIGQLKVCIFKYCLWSFMKI